MIEVLITIIICGTIIWVRHKPIRFEIFKHFEEVIPAEAEETHEEKQKRQKEEEEQQSVYNGLNKLIQLTQEFVGGGIDEDAEPKQQTRQQ